MLKYTKQDFNDYGSMIFCNDKVITIHDAVFRLNLNEASNREQIRRGIALIKKMAVTREPEYELPSDSILEELVKNILSYRNDDS